MRFFHPTNIDNLGFLIFIQEMKYLEFLNFDIKKSGKIMISPLLHL
ncbi:hypothetical protein P872_00810 [Rhodonellum psychrophilum GCM71 = DSM 17998]|uniref:Uncharacterized protein n=1 Tax=Rhodonellum psychrophilum GCM71 = DSM 17998 TaxID=1123057 RepID=U5C794_9BACT|nr:hypothetical protein P872_00810 [Rhodonellum psychrophilum GCM71 = DSM 17998]